ncbi:MAG: class I tRNA ligase family protein, partial [Gammaproteobacteria bacterium]|nr:class I tRNA ligase family protein [Gammaproteobacteria bacterium]
ATEPQALDADGLAPQAELYLEGSDQHRGWFQSSLLTCVAMRGRAPYKAELTHFFTDDEQGRNMSKSLGNVIAPQAVTQTLGADVLRLWVAGSDYAGEIAISDNLLKRVADAYRRIRNTARFLLGNLHGFDPGADALPHEQLLALDRWALARAGALQQELIEAYRQAQFHMVCQKLHHYCVTELGGLYLDVLKDRLYTMPCKSLGRRSAQTAMHHIVEALVRWIAPILSFTADEIWEYRPDKGDAGLFEQRWYRLPDVELGAAEQNRWARLRAVREAVFKALEDARNAGSIGGGLDAEVRLRADTPTLEALAWLGEELRFWLIVSDARAAPLAAIEDPAAIDLEGGGRLLVEIRRCEAAKCARCWQRRPDIGGLDAHPLLCARCVENLGAGEQRRYC